MCGVVSIVYGKTTESLGKEASSLLKKLEYRGYDSTGGAFIKEDGDIVLRKKVGAPSRVIEELEMPKQSGYKFIGQVRWATYGAVTNINAQPHEVNCLVHMVGAHNGNVSNTLKLKEFLIENGHNVLSDNDGEMVVHLIEHFYASLLKKCPDATVDEKIELIIKAIRKAQKMIEGSYAACITTPDIPGVFAIKAGSSLYSGVGVDNSGSFIVVSSDLTSVLSKTRFLIPMSEGDGIYFDSENYKLFSLKSEKEWVPKPSRSRLNIADIQLQPKYHFFMEQEIFSAPRNIDSILLYYFNDAAEKPLHKIFEGSKDKAREILYSLLALYDVYDKSELKKEFEKIRKNEVFKLIFSKVKKYMADPEHFVFKSEETTLLEELLGINGKYFPELWMIDTMLIWKKKRTIIKYRDRLVKCLSQCGKMGGRIYVVASGTSYHAAMTGSYFFNNLSEVSIITANPGTFRSGFINSLDDGDIVIGVSQSGETKDLVDIFNDIKLKKKKIDLVTIVNNENSTLPQEKSDFYLPIMCGSEIAVAATKSFISQIALFYVLAAMIRNDEEDVMDNLRKIKYFMEFTLNNIDIPVSDTAYKLFMKSSMHILGTSLTGLAKEGALKIREVVLNHTEGYDSAEFKHGPNTILGKNTIFSLHNMEDLLGGMIEMFEQLFDSGFFSNESNKGEAVKNYLNMAKNFKFRKLEEKFTSRPFLDKKGNQERFRKVYQMYSEKINIENLFSNYPLVFVCPPDERDKRITVSQINTHKIRGADIVMIAENDEDLKAAVNTKPASDGDYWSKFIELPRTGDRNIFVFQAAVVLQLLALKMSVAKMKYLNKSRIDNHGVHPDVPKNVSKSITVD
jgi:glutamine---fructose-6-phosphate transaminase (isomerizing)